MKILSDFDGVMTEQTEEGLLQRQLFRDKLSEIAPDTIDALIERADDELKKNPSAHGWWSKGRISAFADEDLFIRVIGLATCLDKWAAEGDPTVTAVQRRLGELNMARFESVSGWSYGEMVRHTQTGDSKPLDPVVGDIIKRLLDAGHDIVVVSNSATDRVLDILSSVSPAPVAHTTDPHARFRVRGDARKFELGETENSYEIDGFRFDASRPKYQAILEDEKPNVVIGDVFSLDLALPLQLARTKPEKFGGLRLLLRTRHYTPAWSKKIFGREEEHASFGLLDAFERLPELIGT